MKFAQTLIVALGLSLMAISGWAAGLGAPKGAVLLTVSGEISSQNSEVGARFDREMLRDLDWREVRTFTSFTQGEQVFAGPTLASLLAAVGATGTTLQATAINDYSVAIPVEHANAHDVILAMDRNGAPMRVRDKGPIWVVYPLSESDAAKQTFDQEMIWQLDRLTVR